MGVIFYFSSRSTVGFGGNNQTNRFLLLKSFHVIEYAFLAVLLFFGFKKYKPAIIIGYLYALSDEFHQSFVAGRTSRFRDTLIDLLGILIGLFVLRQICRIKFFKNILY